MKASQILISRNWQEKSASIKVEIDTGNIFVQGLYFRGNRYFMGPRTAKFAKLPLDLLSDALNNAVKPELQNFYQTIWTQAKSLDPWFDYPD